MSQRAITGMLQDLAAGDQAAGARLLPLVYDHLLGLARRQFKLQPDGHTLQPTALVHEAFLKLFDDGSAPSFNDREHFFAVAAKAMRQLLTDQARRNAVAKRGSGWQAVTLEGLVPPSSSKPIDVMALSTALDQLAELDARQAWIVELRFFGGLTIEEVARIVGVSDRTIKEQWRGARAWLRKQLGVRQEGH